MTDQRYRLPRPRQSEPKPPEATAPSPERADGPPVSGPPVGGPPMPRHAAGGAPVGGPPTPRHAAGGAPSAGRRAFVAVREIAVVLVVAMVLSLLIKTFLAQPFWIPSQSMQNTLIPGDRVVVSKLTPGPVDLKRGDVVVFNDFGHWLPPSETTKRSGVGGAAIKSLQFIGLYPSGDDHLIKRVIGLPGDQVICCNTRGQITVNGVGLNEPYIYPGGGTDQKKFSVTVPAGRVWVMGDNRGDSSDSRFHDDGTGATGSVPEDEIVGRAVAVVWPVDRMTWLSNYSSTFDKVPKR